MVQTPIKSISLEAFLAMPETKPASEYIDSEIIQKPMPKGKHRRIPVIGFDLAAAEEFQKLRQIHRRIGSMDLKIAAISITQNATVLTQNLKDFTDIQNLKVEDWSY
jgi:Uma2 family endonuclease